MLINTHEPPTRAHPGPAPSPPQSPSHPPQFEHTSSHQDAPRTTPQGPHSALKPADAPSVAENSRRASAKLTDLPPELNQKILEHLFIDGEFEDFVALAFTNKTMLAAANNAPWLPPAVCRYATAMKAWETTYSGGHNEAEKFESLVKIVEQHAGLIRQWLVSKVPTNLPIAEMRYPSHVVVPTNIPLGINVQITLRVAPQVSASALHALEYRADRLVFSGITNDQAASLAQSTRDAMSNSRATTLVFRQCDFGTGAARWPAAPQCASVEIEQSWQGSEEVARNAAAYAAWLPPSMTSLALDSHMNDTFALALLEQCQPRTALESVVCPLPMDIERLTRLTLPSSLKVLRFRLPPGLIAQQLNSSEARDVFNAFAFAVRDALIQVRQRHPNVSVEFIDYESQSFD